MKIFALVLWPALALLLLGAHFYRAGLWPLAALALALIGLLIVPRAWAARAIQLALLAGSLEWLRSLAVLVGGRFSAGQPYIRLVVILLAVAVFTAGAALVFRTYALRVRYGIGGRI
jgi:hypothetical protein